MWPGFFTPPKKMDNLNIATILGQMKFKNNISVEDLSLAETESIELALKYMKMLIIKFYNTENKTHIFGLIPTHIEQAYPLDKACRKNTIDFIKLLYYKQPLAINDIAHCIKVNILEYVRNNKDKNHIPTFDNWIHIISKKAINSAELGSVRTKIKESLEETEVKKRLQKVYLLTGYAMSQYQIKHQEHQKMFLKQQLELTQNNHKCIDKLVFTLSNIQQSLKRELKEQLMIIHDHPETFAFFNLFKKCLDNKILQLFNAEITILENY